MKWTIRRFSDGKYLYSSKAFVYSRVFAKRFNSEKQAKAAARTSGMRPKEYAAEEFSDESADMLKNELNELIRQKITSDPDFLKKKLF